MLITSVASGSIGRAYRREIAGSCSGDLVGGVDEVCTCRGVCWGVCMWDCGGEMWNCVVLGMYYGALVRAVRLFKLVMWAWGEKGLGI
jgi:hypothetical protein